MVRKLRKTNPYGANQWVADPRQQLFLAYYFDPKSPTFSNAYQSGLKAGFEEHYARNIMDCMPEWLREKLDTYSPMLLQAEKNLSELLQLPSKTQAMGAFGPIFDKPKSKLKKGEVAKPVMVHNIGLLKIKSDVSQFIAERVGKKKYGTKETDPGNTYNFLIFGDEQRSKIAKRIVGGGSVGDISVEE